MKSGVGRRATAWVGVVSGASALVVAAFVPNVAAPLPSSLRRSTPPHAVSRPYRPDSLARATVARDVFRATRRPATVAYDPQRAGDVVPPPVPKPVLVLVGVVEGAEPSAVIEGLPGVEGARVLRVGDQVSGVRVVRIGGGRVRLVGMDTVWVLQVREPWK